MQISATNEISGSDAATSGVSVWGPGPRLGGTVKSSIRWAKDHSKGADIHVDRSGPVSRALDYCRR